MNINDISIVGILLTLMGVYSFLRGYAFRRCTNRKEAALHVLSNSVGIVGLAEYGLGLIFVLSQIPA